MYNSICVTFKNRRNELMVIKLRVVVDYSQKGKGVLIASHGKMCDGNLGVPGRVQCLDLGGSYIALFICKVSLGYTLKVCALYPMYDILSFKMKRRFLGPTPRDF